MTVPPDHDQGVFPMVADLTDQPAEYREYIDTFGAVPRLEQAGDQLAGNTFINMQGHVAIFPIILVEKGELLLTMGIAAIGVLVPAGNLEDPLP